MRPRTSIVLAALLWSAGSVHAQWASSPHLAANPVIDEGFLVAHDDGLGLQAFSAVSQAFRTVAPTGATVHGSGDWTLLIEDPINGIVGYSARHDALAPMPPPFVTPQVIEVEDDVALVIGNTPGGALFAHGYSANTNSWDTIAIATFADVVTSRFVAAFREGLNLYGFAARTGTWVPFFGDVTMNPVADGNVAAYERVVAGNRRLIAFSGVLGVWSLSPVLFPGTSLLVDHNAALGFERLGGGMTAPTGYSAYTGAWVTSPFALLPSEVVQSLIDDNVMLVERTVGPKFEALGARPQAAWAPINATGVSLLGMEESVILMKTANDGLAAFSGLCPGAWDSTTHVPPLGLIELPGKHLVVQDAADDVLAFSAATGTWAAPQNVAGATFYVGDSITVADTATDRFAYSARNNAWNQGPAKAGLLVFESALSESGFASHLVNTFVKDVLFFNERKNEWEGGFDTWIHDVDWYGGRNLLIADATTDPVNPGPIYGYSVQRHDFVTTATGLTGPLTIGPTLEENVAWAVDSAGNLFAFGSPGDVHAYYQWPSGTEYQVMSPAAGPTSLRTTIQGPAAGNAWIAYSLAPDFAGTTLAGFGGAAYIALPPLFVHNAGVISPFGLVQQGLPLPFGGPSCLQVWAQAVTQDPITGMLSFTEPLPEPAWIF